jgi:phosphonate transport system substrate-binding protein
LEESVADRLRRPVPIDFVIYRSYTNGHEGLLSGEVDFMRMGPASYVLLEKKRAGISLIAAQENLIQGGIFTAAGSGIENLSQLKGKPFAFGDVESTLGTHMARLALLRAGIHAGDLSTNSDHFPSHDKVVKAGCCERRDCHPPTPKGKSGGCYTVLQILLKLSPSPPNPSSKMACNIGASFPLYPLTIKLDAIRPAT